MPDGFTIDVDDSSAQLRLAKIGPAVRANLLNVAQTYQAALLSAAQARAPVKTGAYLSSIRGSVTSNEHGVYASVHAGGGRAWYARIIEGGATIGPHDILPKTKQVLRFNGSAGQVFARAVHSPGAHIDARDVLTGPFDEMRDEIVTALTDAVDSAVNAN